MKCMRAVNLFISFSLLVSVEAFAGYGNFGTIVKTARDAQVTAEVDKNPAYGQPAVWNNDCDNSQLFHKTKIIGSTDDRKTMTPEIESQFTGVGHFSLSNNPTDPQASGFLVESNDLVLTNAHVFTSEGKWNGFVSKNGKDLNLNKLGFYIKECNKFYPIAAVDVQTFNPERENGKDMALVKLKEPVCAAARPLKLRVASEKLIENMQAKPNSMSIVGIYDLNSIQNSSGGKGFESSTPKVNGSGPLPTRVYMDCNLSGVTVSSGSMVFEHNCDTSEGGSGGPAVVSLASGTYAFGIHKGFIPGSDNNLGILFHQGTVDWIQNAAKTGSLKKVSL